MGQSLSKGTQAQSRTEKVDNGPGETERVDEIEHLTRANNQILRLLLPAFQELYFVELYLQ